MNSGKRAVLCEKPLAISMTEATPSGRQPKRRARRYSLAPCTPMSPAYRAGLRAWQMTGDRARQIRSAIYLPRNEEFIDQAVELLRGDAPRAPQPKGDQSKILMRHAMLGLAIHDLPLIRNFQPSVGKLHSADFLPPFGYALIAEYGRLHDRTHCRHVWGVGRPNGHSRRSATTTACVVNMPPSFVMAGSAQVELEGSDGRQVLGGNVNGYQALWQAIAETVNDNAPPPSRWKLPSAISPLPSILPTEPMPCRELFHDPKSSERPRFWLLRGEPTA